MNNNRRIRSRRGAVALVMMSCLTAEAVLDSGHPSDGFAVPAGAAETSHSVRRVLGPLTGLPSKPGPHIEKIKSLADDSWLELGSPTPDPRWGRARGRSWTSEMPLAPELRGAFLYGEGQHGYTKPDGHYMDDLSSASTCMIRTAMPGPRTCCPFPRNWVATVKRRTGSTIRS